MDSSFILTRSISESTPLLTDSSVSVNYERPNGPRSIFTCGVVCVLFAELCERLTFYGIGGNLVIFATESDHLNITATQASILSHVFQGTCWSLPVLGGWLADVVGKFPVIRMSAVIYFVGALLFVLGSITKVEIEHCDWASNVLANKTFLITVYTIGLSLVAVGIGGMKSNVCPFGAEQLPNHEPPTIRAFFNWFYWFINIGALLAFTLVAYVQQNISFFYGNIITGCSLVLAVALFLVGKRSYTLSPPVSSALSSTLGIVKEALKKSQRLTLSGSCAKHWLDRAKMSFGGSYSTSEVEDVKKIYRLLPIFVTFILYSTVIAQTSTSLIYQGQYMDVDLSGFQIPVASLVLMDIIGILILIPIMNKLVYPLLGKIKIHVSQLQRVGVGMLFATASMICAGVVEWYRVRKCCIHQYRQGDMLNSTHVADMKIYYQVPQYALIGLSETFTSVTALEFAYSEAPKSVQGVIMGMFMLAVGLGTYFGAAFIALVNAVTEKVNGKDGKWYPDKEYINKSPRFAYYFFLLAGLMLLNFVVYVFVVKNFQNKKRTVNSTLNETGVVPVKVDLDSNNQTSQMAGDGSSTTSGQISGDVD